MKLELTKVHFRTYPQGDVLALFPEVPEDRNGIYCSSYQSTGQHGCASPEQPNTRPATPDEIATLGAELSRLGYLWTPVSRITAAMTARRREAAKDLYREIGTAT